MSEWEIVRHQVAVAGRVTDAETGKPIRGARVSLSSGPATITAADGHFHFLDLPAGKYTLQASLPGRGTRYGPAQKTVTVKWDDPGKFAIANLELPPTTLKGRITKSEPTPPAESTPEFEALTQPEPSTEFTPGQITGCQLWLTAAAITGVNEGDPVAMWPDKSGHNHHADQLKVDRRPTYQPESIGGQPGAYFDGFEDSMTLSFSEPSTNHTFFFVCNSTLLGEGDRSFLFDVKRGRLTLDAADMNPPYKLGWHDSAWHEIAEAQTGPQILTWFFADRTGEVFRNGVLLGQADYTPRSLRGKMSLGANYNGSYGRFNGIIAEVIYYNRALTLVERQWVEQYLSERFGIPLDG